MPLPQWNDRGVLPDGIHRATMAEVYERFVEDAPNRADREVLFHVLQGYLGTLELVVPHGRAWIDGGFAMRKATVPNDVDLVFFPADWEAIRGHPEDGAKILSLLTLQGVFIDSPASMIPRLQPFGGRIDAFLCFPGQEETWEATWSNVKRDGKLVSDESKGFVEVEW